jgi:hypothetical protein
MACGSLSVDKAERGIKVLERERLIGVEQKDTLKGII